jgi:hypothetical protein
MAFAGVAMAPCCVVRCTRASTPTPRLVHSKAPPPETRLYRQGLNRNGLGMVPAGVGSLRGASVVVAAWGRRGREREAATRAEEDAKEAAEEAAEAAVAAVAAAAAAEEEEEDKEGGAFTHPWEQAYAAAGYDADEIADAAAASASAAAADDDDVDTTRPPPIYAKSRSTAVSTAVSTSAPAPPVRLSNFASAVLSVGIFSTVVLAGLVVKKGSDAFKAIPDLGKEVRLRPRTPLHSTNLPVSLYVAISDTCRLKPAQAFKRSRALLNANHQVIIKWSDLKFILAYAAKTRPCTAGAPDSHGRVLHRADSAH